MWRRETFWHRDISPYSVVILKILWSCHKSNVSNRIGFLTIEFLSLDSFSLGDNYRNNTIRFIMCAVLISKYKDSVLECQKIFK